MISLCVYVAHLLVIEKIQMIVDLLVAPILYKGTSRTLLKIYDNI